MTITTVPTPTAPTTCTRAGSAPAVADPTTSTCAEGAPGVTDPAPASSRPASTRGRETRRRRLSRFLAADDGAATAEYAVVILAAVGFAGLLVTIMRSDEVRGVLSDLVRRALTVG